VFASLTNGASVRLGGRWTESPGPKQANELQVEEVHVYGECDPDVSRNHSHHLRIQHSKMLVKKLYPIQKQALTVDYLRDHCHLRTRADRPAAMLRLRDSMLRSFHQYFEVRSFVLYVR
jgi:asparaginyl-tRNA synthetase